MPPGERDELVAVRTAQRLDHVEMILPGALKRVRKRIHKGPDAINFLCQKIDHFDQAGVTAKAEQNLMKTEITIEHRQ